MYTRGIALLAVLAALTLAAPASGDDSTPASDGKPDFSGDKSGTNPINFTFDARLYNEYLWLNTEGDGSRNVTTFEFRAPLLDGKLQFRTRVRATDVAADLNDDGSDDLDSFGLGEVDFRFLTVPHLDMKKRRAVAIGFETFLPTGNSVSGSERLSFGPQIFAVFFAPFGIKNTLVAPAYQHKFSVYEESGTRGLHQGLFDLFVLWTSEDKQNWVLVNPQGLIDYRENIQFGNVDIEVGTMLDRWIDPTGHSVYVCPAFGIGADRPFDASLEAGYKIVW